MAKSYKDTTNTGNREVIFVVCPLCGRSRVLETRVKGRLRWDFFEPETSPIIQVREAGGKIANKVKGGHLPGKAPAIGFPVKMTLTWHETKQLSEYQDQIEKIKNQINKILSLAIDKT